MAELTPIPSPQLPSEAGYQPISGYAVAAAIAAGLFALCLIGLIISSLQSGRTALSYELLFVPVVGIVLAVVGRSHIRNSEGTRIGYGLVSAAWWVCVLGGAGWWAFLFANEIGLESQSERKADQFLKELKAGRLQSAFADCMLAPELRGRAAPDTPEFESVYMMAGYQAFANHTLVAAFQRSRADLEFKHVAAKDVGQEAGGFKATHLYRVTCPEGVFDVQIKLQATESKRGGQLEWYIPASPTPAFTEPIWDTRSQYARLRQELESEGDNFCKQWMVMTTNGRPGLSHLGTLPIDLREAGDRAIWRASFLGGGVAQALQLPPEFLTPERAKKGKTGFDELLEIGFFRQDAEGTPLPDDKLAQLRKVWASPMLGPSMPSRRNPMAGEASEPSTMTVTPTAITLAVPGDLMLNGPQEFAPCVVGAVCSDSAIVNALLAAQKQGASARDDGSLTLRSLPARDWRIAWFRTKLEAVRPPQNPNGPPGGPGGPGGPPGG